MGMNRVAVGGVLCSWVGPEPAWLGPPEASLSPVCASGPECLDPGASLPHPSLGVLSSPAQNQARVRAEPEGCGVSCVSPVVSPSSSLHLSKAMSPLTEGDRVWKASCLVVPLTSPHPVIQPPDAAVGPPWCICLRTGTAMPSAAAHGLHTDSLWGRRLRQPMGPQAESLCPLRSVEGWGCVRGPCLCSRPAPVTGRLHIPHEDTPGWLLPSLGTRCELLFLTG